MRVPGRFKGLDLSRVWWHITVIPITWEVETGGLHIRGHPGQRN
jgi:hypothetical protein